MKKYFIFAVAAVVAMAACTKIETADNTPGKQISFSVGQYVSSKTKAAEEASELTETTSFSSKAWLHANGAADGTNFFGTSTGNYIETITRTGSTGNYVWEPSLEYFWPKNSTSYINFVSWYATNSKTPIITGTDAVSETAMKWGSSSDPMTIASTDNFMFADEAWGYKDNAASTYSNGVSAGVPTLFHHALAKVEFKIQLKTDQTPTAKTVWEVIVQSASLSFGNKGYLQLANAKPSTTPNTRAWSIGTTYSDDSANAATSANVGWTATEGTETVTTDFVTTAQTLTLAPKDAEHLTSGDAASFLAERTVMPQSLSESSFEMAFKIKIYHATNGEKNGDAYSEENINVDATSLASLATTIPSWKMNTKYTYTVTIDPVGKTVKFDPAVAEWASGTAEKEVYTANN